MTRLRGRMNSRQIDRDLPHQVHIVVPEMGFGARLDVMHGWCRQKAIDYMTRGARVRGEPDAMRWCFADPAHADAFHGEFGGERMRLGRRD